MRGAVEGHTRGPRYHEKDSGKLNRPAFASLAHRRLWSQVASTCQELVARLVHYGAQESGAWPEGARGSNSMGGILWAIIVILVVLWLLGLLLNFAGNFIHILLIIALIVLVYNLVAGRRTI